MPKCQPLIARCTNYLSSSISVLNLNNNSCAGCVSSLGTCSKCVDKANSSYYGANCVGCTIVGSNGSCIAC